MATWVDGTTDVTVEVGFGFGPKETPSTWTDISAYVLAPMRIGRGQPSETVRVAPGTLSIPLDIRDRRFDPNHAAGPYFGDLVPMVKIRVTATAAATTITLFTGFVLGWDQAWNYDRNADVGQIVAVDASRLNISAQLAGSAFESDARQDDAIVFFGLQEAEGGYVDAVTGQPQSGAWDLQQTQLAFPLGAQAAVTAVDGAVDGFMRSSAPSNSAAPKSIEFWTDIAASTTLTEAGFTHASSDYIDLAYSTPDGKFLVTYSNSSDNVSSVSEYVGTLPRSGTHHVVLTADASNVYVYVDGELAGSAAHTSTAFAGGTAGFVVGVTDVTAVSNVAVYADTLTATEVAEHYCAGRHAYGHPYGERSGERLERCLDELGWPAGDRDIDPGSTVQGAYRPAKQLLLEYARQLADAEQGVVFVDRDGQIVFRGRQALWQASSAATFSDDGAVSGVVRYERIVPAGNHVDAIGNIVTASYSTVGGITRRDQTSIDAYGEGRRFVDGPTLPNGEAASTLAAYVLRESKDPRSYIREIVCSMLLDASGSLNEFVTLAGLDVGDLVTVKQTPRNVGSESTFVQIVSAITHEIDEEQWTVTISCSPAPSQATDVPYLIVGDATYGRIGSAAGNLIPF